mgnify:CR=1 FL=1
MYTPRRRFHPRPDRCCHSRLGVEDSDQDRPGVQTYGPMGGLGLGFDPRKRASAFIESTYTHLLGPGILDTGRQYVRQMPVPAEGVGAVMSVRAGVVSRF